MIPMLPRTITIGIPAYNEEANIAHLLHDLLRQHGQGFIMERIIVMSDGSSDETAIRARSIPDDRIQVVDDGLRKGKSMRQNDIIDMATSDVLVFLDADIIIEDEYFLDQLTRPILEGRADLTSCSLQEIHPKNFLESMLHASMEFKRIVFGAFRGGKNMYCCAGPVRALSGNLYRSMRFRPGIADDMYTYLFALQNGFEFSFIPEAIVHYKLPETLADYFRQSFRYNSYLDQANSYFEKDFITENTKIPLVSYLFAGLAVLLKYPVSFPGYVILKIVTRIAYLFSRREQSDSWEIARSSKILR